MKHLFRILTLAFAVLTLTGCEPENPAPVDNPSNNEQQDPLHGVALILNEGMWGGNNASLSLLVNDTTGETVDDWFAQKNGRGLGDVAQDMMAYGNKIYITVWGSNSLEVINRSTSRSRRVDLGDLEPRYLASHDGKIYISCYKPNCVVRIDTATLAIESTCLLGDYNPEGMAAVEGKLFVASQKIGNADGSYSYDNKVYVVDLASFANPTTVTVGTNPNKVLALNNQYVVVNCFGDYNASTYSYTDPELCVINVSTLEVTHYDADITDMDVYNNSIRGFRSSYGSTATYCTITGTPTAFTFSSGIMDGGVDPYKININPNTGDEYLTTTGGYTSNGEVRFTSNDKTRTWSRQAGMLPSKIVFL